MIIFGLGGYNDESQSVIEANEQVRQVQSEIVNIQEAKLIAVEDTEKWLEELEKKELPVMKELKERYTKRQLERQMDSGYYERYMLSKDKILPEKVQAELNPFLDSYVIEFLDLPTGFLEKDLCKGLISGMKQFMLEIGKDFTFVDEEYAITVGGEDFRIDLLFYHRTLRCLVAMELKTGKFKSEYVSKMDFYLEGVDRQVKKPDENPSVGLILCAS